MPELKLNEYELKLQFVHEAQRNAVKTTTKEFQVTVIKIFIFLNKFQKTDYAFVLMELSDTTSISALVMISGKNVFRFCIRQLVAVRRRF